MIEYCIISVVVYLSFILFRREYPFLIRASVIFVQSLILALFFSVPTSICTLFVEFVLAACFCERTRRNTLEVLGLPDSPGILSDEDVHKYAHRKWWWNKREEKTRFYQNMQQEICESLNASIFKDDEEVREFIISVKEAGRDIAILDAQGNVVKKW